VEDVLRLLIRHITSAGDDKYCQAYEKNAFLELELQCHAGNGNHIHGNSKDGCKEAIERLITAAGLEKWLDPKTNKARGAYFIKIYNDKSKLRLLKSLDVKLIAKGCYYY